MEINSKASKEEVISRKEKPEDTACCHSPRNVQNWERVENSFLFRCQNEFLLKIDVLDNAVLRFRFARYNFEPDFSYILDSDAEFEAPSLEVDESLAFVLISTNDMVCYVDRSDLRIKIFDKHSQQLISEDLLPLKVRTTILRGTDRITVTKKTFEEESFWGLGDKTGELNLRGQSLTNWNTDAYAYGADTDPLYRSVPFFYGLNNDTAYGIFLHNTYRSNFYFDTAKDSRLTFDVEGGEMDYFFIFGPSLAEVAQRYHQLTGTSNLPPLWALGYHQSRWSYFPADHVREIAKEFRDREIPCDAIYLDIDYMDGYRCFTWDQERFPDPSALISDLKEDGFQTVVIIDPGIKVDPDYWVYREGLRGDVFCRRSTGELMVGPVWPGNCVFPDFTAPDTRQWWQQLYKTLYVENDVSGFWNDMNEPAVFNVARLTFPEDVMHKYDGHLTNHRKAHNIYGMQMVRATYEGLRELRPEKRPFVLSRANFSGGQRFASIWTGDNIATWEHLRLANIQCQRASISGFSFVGTDIGGFAEVASGEMFVRWLQLGVFHPLFRVHSMGNHTSGTGIVDEKAPEVQARIEQEPWSFGEEFTEHAQKAIELRYRLLGYLYSAFWQHSNTGTPIIRSLVFEDQTDPEARQCEREFLCGDHLLVSPVLTEGAEDQTVYFPQGNWFNFWTGKQYQGGKSSSVVVDIKQIPIFARAGAVIPMYPIRQYVNEKPVEKVTLRTYFGENMQTSYLYEDEGDGYDYQDGNYKLRIFTTGGSAERFSIRQTFKGLYASRFQSFTLILFGLPFSPKECVQDSSSVDFEIVADNQLQCTLNADFEEVLVNGQ